MKRETIYLKPTLATKRGMMISDTLPGVILLINGIAQLMDRAEHGKYAVLNILVGVAVLVAFRMEMKHESSAKKKAVEWFNVIAGIVLIVQALNDYNASKIFQPALFYFLLGIIAVCRGIFSTRFPKILKLVCDDTGFILRTRPWRKIQMKWNDIVGLEMVKTTLHIKTEKGKMCKINLRRVDNRNELFSMMNNYMTNR